MRKKIHLLLILLCVFSLSENKTVYAAYFDHHVDWKEYCMQVKDITMKTGELSYYLEQGSLEEYLLEKSEISIMHFYPDKETEAWVRYQGKLYAESEVEYEKLQTSGGEAEITVYLDKDRKQQNYISFILTVTPGEYSKEEAAVDSTLVQSENDQTDINESTQSKRKNSIGFTEIGGNGFKNGGILILLINGILLLGVAGTVYSDFRVLNHYKRKLEARGGTWRWMD